MVLVRPDMRVFGLYVGLTASGYDLARVPGQSPVGSILRAIGMAEWPSPAVRYFAKARRRGSGVSPYWPRAAMLVEACFYLGSTWELSHADELQLLRVIAAFPVSDNDKDSATVDWVREFPRSYGLVVGTDLFPMLWASYLDALGPMLRLFEDAARAALDSFQTVTGMSGDGLPDLTVVPNPLQAPQVADMVRRDGSIFVVVAEPRMPALIHELLHEFLAPMLRAARPEVVAYRHLLRPILPEMLKMQYAWGDDDESWLRVFEESLMRAAAIWIEHASSKSKGDREAALHAEQGFTYVPALLRCLREDWSGLDTGVAFASSCLRSCVRQAGTARRQART